MAGAIFHNQLQDAEVHPDDSGASGFEHYPNVNGTQAEIVQQSKENGNGKISIKDFKILNYLAQGGYGKVFRVRKVTGQDSGTIFAMKVMRKASILGKKKHIQLTRAERNVLTSVRHPFIIDLIYAFQTSDKLCLILEYMCGGDLSTHLRREKLFPEDWVCFYASEVILAIEYLHMHSIIYRDLKPENILLDARGHIKLTDFGLCKEHIQEGTVTYTLCGTIDYMAPEIFMKKGYGKAVDWWSLGILLYIMLTGAPPFFAESRKMTRDNILSGKLNCPPFLTPEAVDLIANFLHRNVSERLGSTPGDGEAIKSHPFFRNINWADVIAKKIEPPIIPSLTGEDDVSQSDTEVTKQPPIDSPDESNFSENANMVFKGFTFIAPSLLDEMYQSPRIVKAPSPI